MKVDLMRYIDRYGGVPIAFFLTCLHKISSLFDRKPGKRPQKILFLKLSEMGSIILADPAMKKARREFGAELFFCIFSKNRESLFILNTVKEKNIFGIRSDSLVHFFVDSVRFLFWCRQNGIDTVVDLELFARSTAILTGLSGCSNRAGFFPFYEEGLYRGDMLTHKVLYNPYMHISGNFIALVNALISDNDEVPYSKTRIEPAETEIDKVEATEEQKKAVMENVREEYPAYDAEVNDIVLVNPFVSETLPQRAWPPAKYTSLIRRMLENSSDILILITGEKSMHDKILYLVEDINDQRCIDFTERLPLRDLPVLYSISSFMLTNDSGPAHFAAVTDMPVYVLYGPETPQLFGAPGNARHIYAGLACSRCVSATNHRKTPCRNNICLKSISEDTVFDLIKPELKVK
jgi:ADP-heptose:LPS heptosyltransferase